MLLIVVWLVVVVIVCMFSFCFVNIWGFKYGIDFVCGCYGNDVDVLGMVMYF